MTEAEDTKEDNLEKDDTDEATLATNVIPTLATHIFTT